MWILSCYINFPYDQAVLAIFVMYIGVDELINFGIKSQLDGKRCAAYSLELHSIKSSTAQSMEVSQDVHFILCDIKIMSSLEKSNSIENLEGLISSSAVAVRPGRDTVSRSKALKSVCQMEDEPSKRNSSQK